MPIRVPVALQFLGALLLANPPLCAAPQYSVSAGPYSAELTTNGIAISHGGERVCLGCSYTAFKPDYKGSLLSLSEAVKAGRAPSLPTGAAWRSRRSSPRGQRSARSRCPSRERARHSAPRVVPGAAIGPVEYTAFMLPRRRRGWRASAACGRLASSAEFRSPPSRSAATWRPLGELLRRDEANADGLQSQRGRRLVRCPGAAVRVEHGLWVFPSPR